MIQTVRTPGAVQKGPAPALARVQSVLRAPGQPLDRATRTLMESRFGHDFGRVRVHADCEAAESARAVNARAYTVGRDIVFAANQYTPQTRAGRALIAHELTHTLQQDMRPADGQPTAISSSDHPNEREATANANWIANDLAPAPGGRPPRGQSSPLASPRLDRAPADGPLPATGSAGATAGCVCDPGEAIPYGIETFHLIASLSLSLSSIAAKARVPALAVAGAIADEYNTQTGWRGQLDRIQDWVISVLPERFSDFLAFWDIHRKLLNVLENDIGDANIKVRTALQLAQSGEIDVPGSSSSDVQIDQIVQLLLDEIEMLRATAAVIAKAQRLFGQYMGGQAEEVQQAVLVEYFKQGDKYFNRFASALFTDPDHKPCPGEGGCDFLFNRDRLEAALAGQLPAHPAKISFAPPKR